MTEKEKYDKKSLLAFLDYIVEEIKSDNLIVSDCKFGIDTVNIYHPVELKMNMYFK